MYEVIIANLYLTQLGFICKFWPQHFSHPQFSNSPLAENFEMKMAQRDYLFSRFYESAHGRMKCSTLYFG
jgi:hypothetical protein